MTTVLYSERMYPDDVEERRIFGPGTDIVVRDVGSLAELSDADCAAADGLMLFRYWLREADFARFTKLRAVVRMGVGYDRIDRVVAARRGVTVCNVPDYGTTEVADHAITLALALSRGLIHHHEHQRGGAPNWLPIRDPAVHRLSSRVFGILGLGRIGTAVALRAKALGIPCRVLRPQTAEWQRPGPGHHPRPKPGGAAGAIQHPVDPRAADAPDARPRRRGSVRRLPTGAVVVNTARGPTMDFDALHAAMLSGHIAAAGLDVMPVEPPVEPIPSLLRAYRDRDPALEGRLIVTPHSAYWSPEADWDIRIKSAETMAAALGNNPQNVIRPRMTILAGPRSHALSSCRQPARRPRRETRPRHHSPRIIMNSRPESRPACSTAPTRRTGSGRTMASSSISSNRGSVTLQAQAAGAEATSLPRVTLFYSYNAADIDLPGGGSGPPRTNAMAGSRMSCSRNRGPLVDTCSWYPPARQTRSTGRQSEAQFC